MNSHNAAYPVPPLAYAHVARAAGKPEAGLRGCGIGPRSATSLLCQFGSIDAVLAAASQGKLAGHSDKVLAAFDPPSAETNPAVALMLANRALTTLNTDPAAVLDPSTMRQLDAHTCAANAKTLCTEKPLSSSLCVHTESLPISWHHPSAVVRRVAHVALGCLPALQASLDAAGTPVVPYCASPLGAAIDLGVLGDDGETVEAAGVVIAPWDVRADAWKAAAGLPERALLRQGVPGCLSAGLRARLRALRREMEVVLYKPW